ncbi:PEP-CTERM sorting domain-containing protein [Geomonas anaerohicana]|uniref:PEP-CTERM sorting domain-containing protein n=1 Tax=Geomonas anaerohicana TaxID=2798583 RepID=A0ABS0YC74_9BACT|nr:PEP-CTERM sorting domain-containing protein [Geomonas anaerohicana]MBJ6749871.1 PEP-CTERM sorting domain-containing protein [Geomonas anaerohicana]
MKKMASLLAGAMLMLAAGGASAYTINYNFATPLPQNGGYSSPYAGVQVETFDSTSLLWNWSGDYTIRTGSASGLAAAPAYMNPLSTADATRYIAVPLVASTGTATATETTAVLGDTFNYFGLWWGSIDGVNGGLGINNVLNFYRDGNLVETVTGDQVIAHLVAAGSWTSADNNRYVNLLGLPDFDSFSVSSVGRAFEADNIAVGVVPVPEPSSVLLLGVGFACLAFWRMKKTV